MREIDEALAQLAAIPHAHGVGQHGAREPCAACVIERAAGVIRASVDELSSSLSRQSMERSHYLALSQRHEESLTVLRETASAKLVELLEVAEKLLDVEGPTGS